MNTTRRQSSVLVFTAAVLILSNAVGCGPSIQELKAVDYTPQDRDDWQVSTPAAQGLDPLLVARMYHEAGQLERIYGLLVVKDGRLIAEKYFNEGSVEKPARVQSVTKSYTSALVGIALEQGCLSSVDQKMIEFFPELADRITNPRKKQITIRQLLQMRAGYPWEESDPGLFEILYSGFRPSHLVEVPLNKDPGTEFEYSNLTSHLLGIIVARACDTDLKAYAEENLFSPIDAEVGDWTESWEGYRCGHAELFVTARDIARFGQLYLDGGVHDGKQIVPADWVEASLERYSDIDNFTGGFPANWGLHPSDVGYGYQWWSATAGEHRFDFAAGHGGQYIALVNELDLVVVTTSDPFVGVHDAESWKHELANFNLVSDFIESLPKGR